MDSLILSAFEKNESQSKKWSNGVLAAKIDVKGPGSNPIEAAIKINKIKDSIHFSKFIVGYEKKFYPREGEFTALGTHYESLKFISDVF